MLGPCVSNDSAAASAAGVQHLGHDQSGSRGKWVYGYTKRVCQRYNDGEQLGRFHIFWIVERDLHTHAESYGLYV